MKLKFDLGMVLRSVIQLPVRRINGVFGISSTSGDSQEINEIDIE